MLFQSLRRHLQKNSLWAKSKKNATSSPNASPTVAPTGSSCSSFTPVSSCELRITIKKILGGQGKGDGSVLSESLSRRLRKTASWAKSKMSPTSSPNTSPIVTPTGSSCLCSTSASSSCEVQTSIPPTIGERSWGTGKGVSFVLPQSVRRQFEKTSSWARSKISPTSSANTSPTGTPSGSSSSLSSTWASSAFSFSS